MRRCRVPRCHRRPLRAADGRLGTNPPATGGHATPNGVPWPAMGDLGDAVERNLANRAARGLPATIDEPAVWRIVANVLANHAAEREKAPVVETTGARNGNASS